MANPYFYTASSSWQLFQAEYFLGLALILISVILIFFHNFSLTKSYRKSKFWQAHGTKRLLLYFIVLAIAFLFLFRGMIYIESVNSSNSNNYDNILSSLTNIQSQNFLSYPVNINNQTTLEIPSGYMNTQIPVTINFTVSSADYFAQNTLFQINATAFFNENENDYVDINSVDIQILGSNLVSLDDNSPSGFDAYPSPITLYLYTANFTSTNHCTFENSGSIPFLIFVTISPNYSNNTAYQGLESYLLAQHESLQNNYNLSYPANELWQHCITGHYE